LEALDDPSLTEPLSTGESLMVSRAVPKRIAEFRAGRHCARRALRELGYVNFELLCGEHREPIWPSGVVGSITHRDSVAAAVVARSDQFSTLGIDVEIAEPLASGLLKFVAVPEEIQMIAEWPGDIPWDKLLFSAKEAFYKAWFPLTHQRLNLHDVRVAILPQLGRFTVEVRTNCSWRDRRCSGRFVVRQGMLWTGFSGLNHGNNVMPRITV
jgi:4'-phosphopantetheinyl transferase EntD